MMPQLPLSRDNAQLRFDVAVIALLLAASLILGVYLGDMALDDPFVTYRYARNVRQGMGLVYNAGERVLSTTSPLFALVLSGLAWLTDDLPSVSNGLSAASLFAAGCFTYLLGKQAQRRWVGAIAGLLLVTSPLLWLSLGFETNFYLALVLGAFCFYFADHVPLAFGLLALALLTRGDGVIPAAVLGLHYLATRRGIPWRGLAAYVVIGAPLLIYLTITFGSPLPVTLAAKSAQAKLGVTGFYAHTSFLEGARILAEAYLHQSWMYVLFVPCLLVGVAALWNGDSTLWPILLWGLVHFLGYVVLGVAPYPWYYAPLVPSMAWLAAQGLTWSMARIRQVPSGVKARAMVVASLLLVVPQLTSDAQIGQALLHPGSTPPDSKVYKVLPEAKVEVYRQVGEWLRVNTPQDALIGVTEVGVMGYYSERAMIDFLGLLRPDVAQALADGNLQWALLYYQPDYVVLTDVNPLYSYDIRTDEWFKLAYAPLQVFKDERFWGGPVTVYRRQTPRYVPQSDVDIPPEAIPLEASFGDPIELMGYEVDHIGVLHPGDILNVTLYWRCLAPVDVDYTVFVHLLGEHELIISQRDAYPCLGACPTRSWKAGETFVDTHMLALPVTAFAPDHAQLEVGLYQQATGQRLPASSGGQVVGSSIRFSPYSIVPAREGPVPNAMQVSFDDQIALVGYNLQQRIAAPGESFHLELYWRALKDIDANYSVFTHLLSSDGERIAQMDSWPQSGQSPTSTWDLGTEILDEYELTVPQYAKPGAYRIHVGLYLPETLGRLWVVDASHQPQSDHLALSPVRVTE